MIVAALRLTFMVSPDNSSHKSLAHKVKDRLWSHFKVATCEVPSSQSTELVIAVSFVGTQESAVQTRVEDIIRHINEWGAVELTNDDSEIIHYNDIEIQRDFEEKYDP